MPGGRPTDYTPELGDYICDQISRKRPLARICDEDSKMPNPRTVYRWLREHEEFCQNYTRAKEDQADYLAEDTLEIADDPELDPADKRIRVDTRKWLASKFKPKKYGDRIHAEHSGSIDQLSEEQIDAKLQALLSKYSNS